MGHEPPIPLADGTVTAVAVARDSFDLIVATTSVVVCWRIDDGRVLPVCPAAGTVIGLSTDPGGGVVYVLTTDEGEFRVRCLAAGRSGSFQAMGQKEWVEGRDPVDGGWYLEPSASFGQGDYQVTVAGPGGRLRLSGWYLRTGYPDRYLSDGRNTHLLVRGGETRAWDWDDRLVRLLATDSGVRVHCRWVPHWTPGVPAGNPLAAPAPGWITPVPGVLEVVGIDLDGVLHWSEFDGRDAEDPGSRSASASHPDGYRAACLTAPGAVAAVTGQNEVHWLRVSGGGFKPWAAAKKLHVPTRVAAVVSRPQANEVIVLLEDASAVRVPRP
jgi:hypothetical protein